MWDLDAAIGAKGEGAESLAEYNTSSRLTSVAVTLGFNLKQEIGEIAEERGQEVEEEERLAEKRERPAEEEKPATEENGRLAEEEEGVAEDGEGEGGETSEDEEEDG